jgi:hypothetical protein
MVGTIPSVGVPGTRRLPGSARHDGWHGTGVYRDSEYVADSGSEEPDSGATPHDYGRALRVLG